METCDDSVDTVASSAASIDVPASLLFSLQFYADRVSLQRLESYDGLLLAFQLLQYEIVLFDGRVEESQSADASEMQTTKIGHGKSCLFEADPDELVRELQRHRDAPLTLLLLAQERGRARLKAFAGVPLILHAGLLLDDGDALSSSVLHRVCEWASQSGRWELKDHHNQSVGWVDGIVTLSCLGKTLAPHLVHALGVQVSKSVPSSPRLQSPRGKESEVNEVETTPNESQLGKAVDEEVNELVKTVEMEKMDSSVQCDAEMLFGDDARPIAAPVVASLPLRDGAIRFHGKSKDAKTASSRTIRSKTNINREHHVPIRHSTRATPATSDLFSRELPPPLFFQKAARPKR